MAADARAVPALAALLDDPYFWVRYPAEQSLIQIGEPSVQPLLEIVGQSRFPASAHAMEALGRIKPAPEVQARISGALEAQLANPDWALRGVAAETLGETGNPLFVEVLARLKASETHPFVRGKIDWAISRILNPPKPEEKK